MKALTADPTIPKREGKYIEMYSASADKYDMRLKSRKD